MIGEDARQLYFRKGTKGLVIKAFDGNLFFSAADMVSAMEAVPLRKNRSPEFEQNEKPLSPKAPYIPPFTHPWKKESFDKFARSRKHRNDLPPAA
jgi:hypothetical protein